MSFLLIAGSVALKIYLDQFCQFISKRKVFKIAIIFTLSIPKLFSIEPGHFIYDSTTSKLS